VHLTAEQRDRFRGDLGELVREAETLMRRAGGRQTQQSADLRNGLRATLRQARSTSVAIDPTLASRAGAMGMTLDDYVREEPWIVVALAGGLGVLVGWLVSRR